MKIPIPFENRARFANRGRIGGVDLIARGRGGQSQPHPGLRQRRLGLLETDAVIGRIDASDELSARDAAAEVDGDGLQTSGNFGADGGPVIGGERSIDDDGGAELPFDSAVGADLFGLPHPRALLPGCGRRVVFARREGECDRED